MQASPGGRPHHTIALALQPPCLRRPRKGRGSCLSFQKNLSLSPLWDTPAPGVDSQDKLWLDSSHHDLGLAETPPSRRESGPISRVSRLHAEPGPWGQMQGLPPLSPWGPQPSLVSLGLSRGAQAIGPQIPGVPRVAGLPCPGGALSPQRCRPGADSFEAGQGWSGHWAPFTANGRTSGLEGRDSPPLDSSALKSHRPRNRVRDARPGERTGGRQVDEDLRPVPPLPGLTCPGARPGAARCREPGEGRRSHPGTPGAGRE